MIINHCLIFWKTFTYKAQKFLQHTIYAILYSRNIMWYTGDSHFKIRKSVFLWRFSKMKNLRFLIYANYKILHIYIIVYSTTCFKDYFPQRSGPLVAQWSKACIDHSASHCLGLNLTWQILV